MKKEDLKIVFFGTPDFAVHSLEAILDNGFNVVGVVTATDKLAGRGHKLLGSPVKKFSEERGLKLMQPESLKDTRFIDELRSLDADLFVVIAFRMLPEAVWGMPRLGTFNLHASLLPKYRGAAPINHAIINGETETGVTTFFLNHEIDTGDIIDRVSVEIGPDENVGSLHDRLMELGASLTVKTINSIIDGSLETIPQKTLTDGGTESCPAPKIYKETGHIVWNNSAETIHNLVRGLSPVPCAWSVLNTGDTTPPVEIKIIKTALTSQASESEPGTVTIDKSRMFVDTATNKIEILELQPSGKKRMTADAYLRGARNIDTSWHFSL